MRRGKPPPVCVMTDLRRSPIQRALQYYSELLSGRSPRLSLLWGRAFASWEEFCSGEEDTLLMLRRAVLVASAEMEARQRRPYFQVPLNFASIVDHRRAKDERTAIAKEILRLRHVPEQLDEWFAPEFFKHVITADDFFTRRIFDFRWS